MGKNGKGNRSEGKKRKPFMSTVGGGQVGKSPLDILKDSEGRNAPILEGKKGEMREQSFGKCKKKGN